MQEIIIQFPAFKELKMSAFTVLQKYKPYLFQW